MFRSIGLWTRFAAYRRRRYNHVEKGSKLSGRAPWELRVRDARLRDSSPGHSRGPSRTAVLHRTVSHQIHPSLDSSGIAGNQPGQLFRPCGRPRPVPGNSSIPRRQPESYVLPAITCLIDGNVHFDQPVEKGHPFGLGSLRVPLNSRILILDGVNRRAGVEMALKLRQTRRRSSPHTILCRFQPKGVEQILSDIRRNGSVRAQGILCDLRDETAVITKELVSVRRKTTLSPEPQAERW